MYVYFDIGGTKTRVSVSHDGKSFEEPRKFATPKKIEVLYTAIHDTARAIGGTDTIEAAGGGIACSVDRSTRKLGWGPNLSQDWFEHDFIKELGDVLDCPVFLDNDTAVIGIGEAHHGAGKGQEIVAYMTISTGVGGARIVQGKSDVLGLSSEPGWQYLDLDKTCCSNCDSGNAQIMLSGASMAKRYAKPPYEITDPLVWEQMAEWTAYMLNNTIVHWAPDIVVLGGSMITGNPAIPVEIIRERLKAILHYPKMPSIEKSTLGDFGGIYGAMEFVNNKVRD